MKQKIFGGLDAARFLRRHWQKRPLLARDALSECVARISREELFELATREDVESRIVTQTRGRWSVRHGPFARRDIARLPKRQWTLLVQGVDHVLPAASELLRQFSFIPYARLDDVMVSYAAPGGGVGPHFDSYDVFLVQASGNRRWRVGAPRDWAIDEKAPLKILRRFEPDDEWLVEPGDLLYVPPNWGHDGVALDECITCSVGFRAPDARELASRFFDYVLDALDLEGVYSDPDLQPTSAPGRLDNRMVKRLGAMLGKLRWSAADVERFIGSYVSEPKPGVVFARPRRPLGKDAFGAAVLRRGVSLAPASRMLYRGAWIFLNGEAFNAGRAAATLRTLADARTLPPHTLDANARPFLYDAYLAGYIRLAS